MIRNAVETKLAEGESTKTDSESEDGEPKAAPSRKRKRSEDVTPPPQATRKSDRVKTRGEERIANPLLERDGMGVWRYVLTVEPLGGPGASDTQTTSRKKKKKKKSKEERSPDSSHSPVKMIRDFLKGRKRDKKK